MTLKHRFVVLRALRWAPLGVLLPVMVLVPLDRGLTLAAVGVAFAVHSVVAMVLEVPSGSLADAVGRRRVLLAGGALMTVALAGFGLADSVATYAAALAVLAAARALISGSLEAWFVDELRSGEPDVALRGNMAAGTAAEGVAMAAGAIAGGALPALLGSFTPTVILAIALSALYVAAVAALVRETTAPLRGRPEADARTVAVLRARPQVRLLLVLVAMIGVAQAGIELLWQPRLTQLLGGDALDSALVLGMLTAASMVAVAVGAMASRLRYAAALAIGGMAVMGLALAGSVAIFAVAYLTWFATLGAVDPVHAEALHNAVPSSTRATLASVDGLANQSGGLVGNLALPALATSAGPPWGFALAAATLLVAAVLARNVLPAGADARLGRSMVRPPTGVTGHARPHERP